MYVANLGDVSRDPKKVGCWGSKEGQGGYLESPKLGPTHRWLVCREWGVYVCILHYVCGTSVLYVLE